MIDLLRRTASAALVMVLHLMLAVTASACLKVSELAWGWLFQREDPMVLGIFPFRWILEASEAGITIVFTAAGLVEAVTLMRRQKSYARDDGRPVLNVWKP